MSRLLEIRTYCLKPGTHGVFDVVMRNVAVPFIRAKGMDVVAFGRSDHEAETYFLIRAYQNRAALEKEQAQFYGSADWQSGPRLKLVAHIDSYVNTLIYLEDAAVESMRKLNQRSAQ